LKADNILVEMSGICKISDFWISKRTDDLHRGAMQETVSWMAPEVINTQTKEYNFKINIWSVGCLVLEMWAGIQPWMGEEMVAVMFKVCSACCTCYFVTNTLQLYQSKLPPPVPEGVVLSELADDFRRKCFAMYKLFLVGFLRADATILRNPEERPSAAELRKHPYLVLPADWTFTGLT
jgi:serine/threonine protein kinase